MFAKLFGPADDQVLVKLDANAKTGEPEICIFFEPPGEPVRSIVLGFLNTEEGWDKAEAAFANMDEAEARRGIEAARGRFGVDFVLDGPGAPAGA